MRDKCRSHPEHATAAARYSRAIRTAMQSVMNAFEKKRGPSNLARRHGWNNSRTRDGIDSRRARS